MKSQKPKLLLAIAAVMLGVSLNAQAALIPGVAQTFPDVSMLNATYLVYDHNGGGATTGRLLIVTQPDTLNEGAAAGNSTQAQTYAAITQVLSIDIVSSGANAGAFVGGSVSIVSGTGAAKFQWLGTLSNAGFNTVGTSTAPLLNGTWTVTGDSYAGLPVSLSQFVNGYLAGGILGTAAACLFAILPPWLVRNRVERLNEG